MKIKLHAVPIRDLYDGYENAENEGVVGYGGALDIRPKFQREFICDDDKQRAVIKTILSGFPLNVMYWSKKTDSETQEDAFEMLDGQQRTMSICEYIYGNYSVDVNGNPKNFDTLSAADRQRLLDTS